ncbi:MAG: rhamnogalacturonan lyase B N-terminal domain-containing protein [Planctomycetaceae bacterium]
MNRTRQHRRVAARHGLVVEGLEGRRMLAFGITTSTTPTGQQTYVIDNGGDLACAILKGGTTSSTIHLGDLTSIKYRNQELLAPYSTTSRYSHYEQGLGSTTVITTATGGTVGSRWILVTCDDTATGGTGVVQYYAVRENDTNLYLSCYVPNPTSEGRFIAYLSRSVFTNPEEPSDNSGTSGAIEGSDVFGHADGTTSSKFYNVGGRRQIEHVFHGLAGTAGSTPVGAWMFMGSRERSSGGPFFKDIDFQSGSAVEIYNCIFTGHTQTEPYRAGLHTFALQINGGQQPTEPSYAWMENLRDLPTNAALIQGMIPTSQRGGVAGVATGIAAGHEITIGLANAEAQYWDVADVTGGFKIPGVLPGTYTQTLYDGELEVGRRTVTVTAGATTTANIVNSFFLPSNPIFRVGTFDGTPVGFLNADKIETMHPSDVRMAAWAGLPNFVVGTNTDAQFPMAQFMGVNNSRRFTFTLTAAQVQNLTFRVGITLGFEGARPKITVNAGQSYAWTSGNPTASVDLNSRGITRGTWRGDNQLYTFGIPSTAFRAGTNTIDMSMISGSYVSGQTWLSPNAVFDAIDLVPTSSASPPTITGVSVTPAAATIGVGTAKAFAAVATASTGGAATVNIDWSAELGMIRPGGGYVAPATPGTDTITARATITRTPGYSTGTGTSSTITDSVTATGSTTLTVVGLTPVVVTAAAAAPAPSYTKSAVLTALGSDDGGEATLTYTWSVVGTPPGTVTFSAANGTNAGKSTTATFATAGTYGLQVVIADATGSSAISLTSLVVRNADTQLLADETTGTMLADATGNGNAATLAGAATLVTGLRGNAVKFSGGHATLPTGIVSGLGDFTIAAWVKPDSIATWQRIFDFGSSTSSSMFLTTRPTTAGGLRFAITTGSGEQQVNTASPLAVGVWQHVAVTLRGSTATIYLNGTAVGANAAVSLRPSSLGQTTNNFIGKSQFAADPALAAAVDDFRIYARGLTAAEVQALAAPDVTINVPAGQSVTDVLRTGAGAVIKDGLGTLVLDKANTHEGGTVVNAGTLVVRHVSALGSGGLQVRAGARVQLDVGGGTIPLSSIALETGATIDLGIGRLTVAAGSLTAADVQSLLVAGRGDGSWNGAGGFVTRAASPDAGLGLGALVNDDGSILVAFAAAGDVNLDGQVDVVDLSMLLGVGTLDTAVSHGWADGDFNYDGFFDILDIGAFLATNLYDTGPY